MAMSEHNEELVERLRKESTKETLIDEILDHLGERLLYPPPRETNLYALNKTTLAVLVLGLRN